ncbi:MAG TPA: hypothetical protein VF622_01985 [Segetibacter sp.]|jgi:hypothetical protein
MIQEDNNQTNQQENDSNTSNESKSEQQQSDPQLTELKGFTDPKEDIEPTLEDGTKGPEKLEEENENNTLENNNS